MTLAFWGSPAPPAGVVCALAAQTTSRLMCAVERFAELRVKRLRLAGSPVSATQARELVADAYADTWIGALPWDPDRCDLGTHLRTAIKQRTWRELRRARRFAAVAWHEVSTEDVMDTQLEGALAHSAAAARHRDALAAMLASTCERLRRLAHHEHEVSVLTRGWEAGLVEQDEVLSGTGLSRTSYTRARRRALYMSRQLPAEFREAVRTLLRTV